MKIKIISMIIGIILVILTLINIVLGYKYVNSLALELIMILVGIYFIYSHLKSHLLVTKIVAIVAGLILIVLGLLPVLVNSRLVDFSFFVLLSVNTVTLSIILLIAGVYYVLESFLKN